MSENEFVKELRRSAKCIFLAISEPAATDLFKQIHEAADIISTFKAENEQLRNTLKEIVKYGKGLGVLKTKCAEEIIILAIKAIQGDEGKI